MSGQVRRWTAACAAALGLALVSGGAAAARSCPEVGFMVVEPARSADTRPVRAGPDHKLAVRKQPLSTTADLTEIRLAGDEDDTLIRMRFTPEAAKRLHDATTGHDGMRLAFVADGEVRMAFTWSGPYGMDADLGTQLSVPHGVVWARPLVAALQTCVGKGAGAPPR